MDGKTFLVPLGTVSNTEVDCSILQHQRVDKDLSSDLGKKKYGLFCSLKEDRSNNSLTYFETDGLMMSRYVAFVENMVLLKAVQANEKHRFAGQYFFSYAIVPIPNLKQLKKSKGFFENIKDKLTPTITMDIKWMTLETH